MKLNNNKKEFQELITLTARWRNIPEDAVKRDYFIIMMLNQLAQSQYADSCVFKGGTSLSKAYPGSIERFSEDIDLTYIPDEELTNKQYSRKLKQIEKIMSEDAALYKIEDERNDRNKSSFVSWADEPESKIKLEIGSSVRPDPYEKRTIKTYIQEYLEYMGNNEVILEYELSPVTINTLCIERTFIDKVMAVKRHACCDTLQSKVRHIYDVTRLYSMPEIQDFLQDKTELKRLLSLTKDTDSFYLEKRGIAKEYNPKGKFDFSSWEIYFDKNIQKRYEELHRDLLYTDEKQNFSDAINVFYELNEIFAEIGE